MSFAGETMKQKILRLIGQFLLENGYIITELEMNSGDLDVEKEIVATIIIRAKK